MMDAKHCRTEQTGVCSRSATIRKKLYRDTAGNVLPLTAGIVIVLAALVGGGVDMARAYKAERRMQAACDAGALAGRRAVTSASTTTTLEPAAVSAANTYWNANYDLAAQGTLNTNFTPSTTDKGNTVIGTATASLPTVIMKIFGYNAIPLSVTCNASMGIGNSDITFVLDNTYSMRFYPTSNSVAPVADSRITALKGAMKSFYDIVATATRNTNARIRYSFVPYGSTANVGALLTALSPDYVADQITVPSVQYVNWSTNPTRTWTGTDYTYSGTTWGTWSHHSTTQYNSSTSCNNATRPADTAWADDGAMTYATVEYEVDGATGNQIKKSGTRQPQTMIDYGCIQTSGKYYIDKRTGYRTESGFDYEERTPVTVTGDGTTFVSAVLQTRTFDTSNFKTFASTTLPIGVNYTTGNRIKNVSSTWRGCVGERATTPAPTFSFVSLAAGIVGSNSVTPLDLNIDTAPTSDTSTRWVPQWWEVTFGRDGTDPFEDLDGTDSGTTVSKSEYEENQAVYNKETTNAPGSYCPVAAKLLEEYPEGTKKQNFYDYVDSMSADAWGTYHESGLLWGARLSSPTGLWQTLVNQEPQNAATVSKHMIFMTDGDSDPFTDVNGMYGMESIERRITGTANISTLEARNTSRALALCEAIKARGIRLWVIAFGYGVNDFATLQTCASPDSAFKSDNTAQLNASFQAIAKQVGELRVTL